MHLDKILKLTDEGLSIRMEKELFRQGYNVIHGNGYYFAEGSIPVLLIAHINSIHEEQPIEICKSENFWMAPEGIGGENRCGIYALLQIVRHYHCHILLLNDKINNNITSLLNGLSEDFYIAFAIDLALEGKNECLIHRCTDVMIRSALKERGYELTPSAAILEFPKNLKLTYISISTGFYDSYLQSERICIDDVWHSVRTIERILDMIADDNISTIDDLSGEPILLLPNFDSLPEFSAVC